MGTSGLLRTCSQEKPARRVEAWDIEGEKGKQEWDLKQSPMEGGFILIPQGPLDVFVPT